MSLAKRMEMFGKEMDRIEKETGRNTPALGIDLGTTNSCVAIVRAGNTPEIIPLSRGNTMPSCVQWKGKRKGFTVGWEAYAERYKASCLYSGKRLMGTDEEVKLMYGRESLTITPVEFSAEILKKLVSEVSDRYKGIKDVVISLPAYFNDRQVKDTIKAGELAGLNVLSIIREPTAASLVYDIEEVEEGATLNVLVYDLGGGTFDSSLARITKAGGMSKEFEELYGDTSESTAKTTYTIIATQGDSKLGGDDIDRELYNIAIRKMDNDGVETWRMSRPDREMLILAMERFKKAGAGQYEKTLRGMYVNGKKTEYKLVITEADFVEATKIIYNKTKVIMDSILTKIDVTDLHSIVLVGGSTKSSIIRALLQRDFKGTKINYALNPDEAVALGSAIKAKAEKFGDGHLEVFDVLPMAIGILTEGRIRPLLHSNQRVPHSETVLFTPVDDYQPTLELEVYQSPTSLVEDGLRLGILEIKNLPKRKADDVDVYVTLKVDSQGLLVCEATIDEKTYDLELTNLFKGKAATDSNLDQEEVKKIRQIGKWRRFAETLTGDAKEDVLSSVMDYEEGHMTKQEVAAVIAKYIKATKPISAPEIRKDEIHEVGED